MLLTDRNFNTSFYVPAGGKIWIKPHYIKNIIKTLLYTGKVLYTLILNSNNSINKW